MSEDNLITSKNKKYDEMITAIANLSHEKFRKIYREGNKDTGVKITKDKAWIEKYGTNKADLAQLKYFELPSDWQKERWAGAKVALDILLETVKAEKSLNEKFVEHASNIIHQEWLKRNIKRAKDEHKISYKQLSEEAKEKDRIFARAAIEIYQLKK